MRPHASRNVTVKLADCIGGARHFQSDHRHAKGLFLVVRFDSPKAHQLVMVESQFVGHGANMFFDQFGTETIVPGRNRCVSCEHGFRGHLSQCFVERLSGFLHSQIDCLQRSKSTVSFVQVIDTRTNSQFVQSRYSADSQN